jgi:hypothetical protein
VKYCQLKLNYVFSDYILTSFQEFSHLTKTLEANKGDN